MKKAYLIPLAEEIEVATRVVCLSGQELTNVIIATGELNCPANFDNDSD